uniref:Uncharacterized protein n=1 Tax=Avena sativa TaxID=4498 RepID=A0ACD5ZVJ5_AVESA
MYNGAGLPTARGSGTSGRVHSNKFLPRPHPSPSSSAAPASSVPGGARDGGFREEMAEHERKRALESRLLELREALEEQGYTEVEADARVAEARKAAAVEALQPASAAKEESGGGCWPKGTPL